MHTPMRTYRIDSTRLDSMAYGELYVRAAYLPPTYTRIQRGLRARHGTTYKARRDRALLN